MRAMPDGPDPGEVVARLEAAAERLRARDLRPAATEIPEPSPAQLRMRAARRRLAQLEAELGWEMKVRRGP
jgi:hypothetical protein